MFGYKKKNRKLLFCILINMHPYVYFHNYLKLCILCFMSMILYTFCRGFTS